MDKGPKKHKMAREKEEKMRGWAYELDWNK